jgi:hypothetical protein
VNVVVPEHGHVVGTLWRAEEEGAGRDVLGQRRGAGSRGVGPKEEERMKEKNERKRERRKEKGK